MFRTAILAAAATVVVATLAAAEDAYVIGLTGTLTGPAASAYAPTIDGLRAYAERVNAAGGIAGKPIQIVIQDDSGEPSKAAANAKRLIGERKLVLFITVSPSSTYAPVLAEAKRAQIPVIFVGGACPKEAYPPADALQFCTTGLEPRYDATAAFAFINEIKDAPVRLGLIAASIPLSRNGIEFAEGHAREVGFSPVSKEIIPLGTADYTPFAMKLKEADPTWVYAWAPWLIQARTFESLRRLGWQGFFFAWGQIEAEAELARLKDDKLYMIGSHALFKDNLPVHEEIRAAARAANVRYPAEQLPEGWVAGMVIEATLKAAGWPVTSAKLADAMQTISVDTKGLRGGPIKWTKENHARKQQHYRVYRWDSTKSAIVTVRDWLQYHLE